MRPSENIGFTGIAFGGPASTPTSARGALPNGNRRGLQALEFGRITRGCDCFLLVRAVSYRSLFGSAFFIEGFRTGACYDLGKVFIQKAAVIPHESRDS